MDDKKIIDFINEELRSALYPTEAADNMESALYPTEAADNMEIARLSRENAYLKEVIRRKNEILEIIFRKNAYVYDDEIDLCKEVSEEYEK